MEAFFVAVASLLVVIVTSFFFRNRLSSKQTPHSRLPPGTSGWPFIGETLDYIQKLRNGNLREFVLHRVKKFGSNVFTTSIIGHPIAMLCGPEGNKLLFSNENKLVNIWFPRTIERIFAKSHGKPVGDDFAHVRNILRNYLMPSALQKHVATIDIVTKLELEGRWKPNKTALVHDLAGRYAIGVVCRLFLGSTDPSMIEKLEQPENDISNGIVSMPINFPGTTFYRALKASKKLRALLVEVIRQRKIDIASGKASRMQDILSEMVNAKDENGELLKEDDIAAHLIGLIHGGYDPVRSGLTFIVKYMAELPEVYDQVFREQMEIKKSKEENETVNWEDMKKMKYSWNVVQEVFRVMPPVLGTFRRAIKEFTFGGYTIPKGHRIHWTAYYTHMDPKYFPNPEKFDPSRFEGNGPPPFSYVPFGGGPRMCPGIEYAKMVTLVFMHNMVTKYKWELLVPDEKVIIDHHPRPTQGLPVRLRLHDVPLYK